ncbi:MAG: class I SAM-dependent methyltransferase [Acidobacteria bacterium]|nr:class I SAM-dependent methyltransferase [Acidobacteriota bacterium]
MGSDPVATDYRQSHLHKGADYDRDLSRGDFNTYMTEREGEILERIAAKFFPGGIPRYLDFACGTGRITQRVSAHAAESYGVDVSANMVEQARLKCPRTTFIVRDLTRDSAGIAPVNLVTSFRFLGDAQDELRRGALKAIHDLLVPGGYFVFNNHLNPWSIHNTLLRMSGKGERVDLTWTKLRRLLREAGFKIVASYGIGFWLVRYKLDRPEVFRSPLVRVLEPVSKFPPLVPFCPDAVFVAQRV